MDVICAYNFSSFLLHPRAELVAYLKQVRESLAEGGMFFMDCYGGWDAMRPLLERHDIESPGGTFEYTWDQDSFNPIDNLTTCHIHFRFGDGKKIKKAFTYQLENTCFSLVEVISTCPTNWGVPPAEATQWLEKNMLPYYPLGIFKTPTSGSREPLPLDVAGVRAGV